MPDLNMMKHNKGVGGKQSNASNEFGSFGVQGSPILLDSELQL